MHRGGSSFLGSGWSIPGVQNGQFGGPGRPCGGVGKGSRMVILGVRKSLFIKEIDILGHF